MSFKFEKLIIWQQAMDLGEDINIITKKFTQKGICNLSYQIRRVGDSIALSISKGSIGQSNLEQKKFSLCCPVVSRSCNLLI